MTTPQQARPGAELPGGFMVDWQATAGRRSAAQTLQSADLANGASIGAILVANGVDPIVANAVVSDVQSLINAAVIASIHTVAAAMSHARQQQSKAISNALAATGRIDMWGARQTLAAILADPTIAVTRDPTPSLVPYHGTDMPDGNGRHPRGWNGGPQPQQ